MKKSFELPQPDDNDTQQRPRTLNTIFSMTGTAVEGGNRGILNRVAILEALRKGGTLRAVDIARLSGAGANDLKPHLTDLVNLGYVTYESSGHERGYSKYTLVTGVTAEQARQLKAPDRINGKVFDAFTDLLFEYGVIDRNFLMEQLRSPRFGFTSQTESTMSTAVYYAIGFLKEYKICSQQENSFTQTDRSAASLTPAGVQLVDEILTPIRQALAGDEVLLAEWNAISWQSYAPTVLERFSRSSRHVNAIPKEESLRRVLALVESTPGIRPFEVSLQLGIDTTTFLTELAKDKKIQKVKEGRSMKCFPVEQ